MTIHQPSCRWARAECEYKATHHYCPHPEHACDCEPTEEPTPGCDGGKHYWPPDYSAGDTCQCGSLYLLRIPSGGICVEERQ